MKKPMEQTGAFPHVPTGSFPTAADYNRAMRLLADLSRWWVETRPYSSRFRIGHLLEPIGPDQLEDSEFHNRSARMRYYDPATNSFRAKAEDKSTIVDATGYVFEDDQIVFLLYSAQAGKHIPVNPITVRHAVTVREYGDHFPGGSYYPAEHERPDTYAIKFIRVAYQEVAGRRGHLSTYLDPQADPTDPDDYAHDLSELRYLPEGAEIVVYGLPKVDSPGAVQWFVVQGGEFDEESSSQSLEQSSQSETSGGESDGLSDGLSDQSGGECQEAIPADMTLIPGFELGAKQVLGHPAGSRCWRWFTVGTCD